MRSRASLPPKLLAVVVPVCLAGLVVVGAAIGNFATVHHPASDVVAALGLLVAMALAERFPVPVDGADAGGLSLGFVFALSGIMLFGWEVGVLLAAGGPTIMHLIDHRPKLRVAYNASMFALAAAAAGAAATLFPGDDVGPLLARLAVCSVIYNWVVNLALISAVLSISAGKPFWQIVRSNVRSTSAPFALMASAALMLVVLWERSPLLSVALVGPLLAIALYQRSTHRELRAMRLALTDPLTGLGNHRHFQERLQRELVVAEEQRTPLSLCLIDLDDFKHVNDTYGHPEGDQVLSNVAARLRQGGEAFRLGGDEFALLLPGQDGREALAAATAVVSRIRSLELEVGDVTVSAGIASFPQQGVGRDELIRLADSALYWAKEHGKNRVHLYQPDVVELATFERLASGPDRAARYRAAASLAKAVDARDAYTGSHSARVSAMAGRVAARLGLDDETIELTRLAASLHDVGKLAIPEELLRKPSGLTDSERLVLQRHPQIGFRMLDGLGVDPVAEWVLHHHERWDGGGYPSGLSGDSIPLGARIIFVADAFDAMTSERVYRDKLSDEEALEEIQRCAGAQFDPDVVDAFADELGLVPIAA
jgi:diguanylate cyclase (GGDEF)-like protein